MGKDRSTVTDFSNQALIQEETLLTICQVLEQGFPAGPTFLHALNTLIETVVLHDAVYFDTRYSFRENGLSPEWIDAKLQSSAFVRLLVKEGALHEFPDKSAVDAHLASQGREYRYDYFLEEAVWTQDSFAYGRPEGEAQRLELYLDVVSKAPRLMRPQRLLPGEPLPREGFSQDGHEILLMMLGRSISLSDEDLVVLEGLNFRAKAFLDLARNIGLHLHPFFLALPHQVGAIRHNNSKAMQLYRKIQEAQISMEEQDESVGESSFSRVPIPALADVLLGRCKDSCDAIAPELLELRAAHRGFPNT